MQDVKLKITKNKIHLYIFQFHGKFFLGSLASRTSRRTNGIVYPGMTATTNEDSIQALSYCAKNPSQKLPAEQAKIIRKQQRKQNISNNINLNTEENVEDDDDLFEKKVHFTIYMLFFEPIM